MVIRKDRVIVDIRRGGLSEIVDIGRATVLERDRHMEK